MADLYEGRADQRQAETPISTSRFRPRYRQLENSEVILHDAIKKQAEELESLFKLLPHGRYNSLAMTSLEEAVMWAIKQLTA
jgi:hypothetical protein